MRHINIILFFTLFSFSCVHKTKYPYKLSDFRPELKRQLGKLASENELPSKDTIARKFLRDSCSKDELLKILNCEIPLLRIISYRTIVNRNEPDYFKILLNHLDDTAKVVWWVYEDVRDIAKVSDLMIRKAEASQKLTQLQRDTLVDVVLRNHPYLQTANWMIASILPQAKYYSIIKREAQKKSKNCNQERVVYALSKFKKRNDIAFIKAALTNSDEDCKEIVFKTVEAFPDTTLFFALTKYFEQEIKRKKQFGSDDLKYFSRAVAVFKNENSLRILTALTNGETYPDTWYLRYNKEYVFKAIHKYPSPLYDNLYNELKPQMSDFVMENLDKPDYDDRMIW